MQQDRGQFHQTSRHRINRSHDQNSLFSSFNAIQESWKCFPNMSPSNQHACIMHARIYIAYRVVILELHFNFSLGLAENGLKPINELFHHSL